MAEKCFACSGTGRLSLPDIKPEKSYCEWCFGLGTRYEGKDYFPKIAIWKKNMLILFKLLKYGE